MGHREKLPAPPHKASYSKSEPPPAKMAQTPGGPGNRDLLSSLGAGRPLPSPVQAKMEQAMDADFSAVRLHESPLVAQEGAEAAAAGARVAFAPGKLDLGSTAGLELLGHELSHVASQARGEVAGSGLVQNAALERKADQEGTRAAHGFTAQDPVTGSTLRPLSMG